MKGRPQNLTHAEFSALLPNLSDTHFTAFSFGGFSEPFDNPEIVSLLSLASEQPFVDELWVYTNGESLTPEIFSQLESIPLAIVDVSCHGFDAEVYRRTRSFIDPQRVRANLVHVLQHRENIARLTVSVTGPFGSESDFDQLQRLCETYGARFERRSLHSRAGLLQIGQIRSKQPGPFRCAKFDFEKPVLLPGGDLSLCCQDFGLEQIIGNLHRQTFDEIMSTSPVRQHVLNVARGVEDDPNLRCYECLFCVPVPTTLKASASAGQPGARR
jgi:hypothetical protein